MRLFIQAPAIALLALALSACDNSAEIQSTTAKATPAPAPKNDAKPVSTETTATPIKNEVAYSASVVPEKMTVQEKKARFRQLLTPAINTVYAELLAKYEEVAEILADGKPHPEFDALKKEYRAKNNEELLQALKPHPRSIVIAQAAMESAWATSRFFRKANNVFGVWSFDKNEPRIAAGEQRGAKTIWLKKYSTIEASVRDNYRVLARGHKFTGFRKLRMTSEDPYKLVKQLDAYSELGAKYGEELSSVIRFNKFTELDKVK
jgi:Bax protein